MYAMIGSALHQEIRFEHGDAAWQRVAGRAAFAGDDDPARIDDRRAHELIEAACVELGKTPPALLEWLAEHWITHVAAERGDWLQQCGRSLPGLLGSLDRVEPAPPEAARAFRCTRVGPHSLVLHCYSPAPDLSPFVTGLVRGIARLCGQPVRVTPINERGRGDDHDSFWVEFGEDGLQ